MAQQRVENVASSAAKNGQCASIAPNPSAIARAITNALSSSTPPAPPTFLAMPLALPDPSPLLHL